MIKFVNKKHRQGFSLRKISDELARTFNIVVSHSTISKWIKYDLKTMAKQKNRENKFKIRLLENDLKKIKSKMDELEISKINLHKRFIKKKILLTMIANPNKKQLIKKSA